MPQANQPGNCVRFGIFEIDTAVGELRRQGNRVKLQAQPFQVLVMLLQTPGVVVSREEIRARLWGEDTFVDFDHSLNTAVNKIREALGDSATNPRYVETVAKRGYRFIGAIDSSSNGSIPASNNAQTQPIPASNAFHPELNIPLPHRAVPRILFALIQV